MATTLTAPGGEPSTVEAALRWLARPDDPQLRLLLAVCAGAALLGLADRWLARGRRSPTNRDKNAAPPAAS